MNLERKLLLDALETVRPGISAKAQVDEFAHVWFDGKTVMAYNDADIGIECPFPSELKGGLRGPLLLGMLAASRAKELEITAVDKGELLLKAGSTKLTLPLLSIKQTVWTFPDTSEEKPISLTKELLGAVAAVMVSTSDPEPSVPEKLGITFENKNDLVNVYATDSVTLAASHFPTPKGFKHDRLTIPTQFWNEVLKQCKKGGKLWVMADCVIAQSVDNVRIFSKLVNVERPVDFADAFSNSLPKGWLKKLQAIPTRLPLAFQRASILLEGHDAEAVAVTIRDNVMRMEAKSSFGELKEVIKLEATEDVKVTLDPELVRRGVGQCDRMLVTADCMAMFGENNLIYLVSACL